MAATPAVPDMRLELVPDPGIGRRPGEGILPAGWIWQSARHPGHRGYAGGAADPARLELRHRLRHGDGPITEMVPGSVKGLHLVVDDMVATRAALSERGIELSDVDDMGGVLYSYFSDPDGNMWALQQWPAGYQG